MRSFFCLRAAISSLSLDLSLENKNGGGQKQQQHNKMTTEGKYEVPTEVMIA